MPSPITILYQRLMPTPFQYIKYIKRGQVLNIGKPSVVLSLDCDTPEDACAALKISHWFKENNIPAVFAVPGVTLIENSDIYRKVANMGFEFMNHGFEKHAAWDKGKNRYVSITWYNKMSAADVEQDILKGHETLLDFIGKKPLGFRAPHFGTFQKPDQVDLIHRIIKRLGYLYSTTTGPDWGLKHGPVKFSTMEDIYEFPVSGQYDYPEWGLDSWGFLAAPNRRYSGDDYVVQFKKMVDFFVSRQVPGILNYYVDPAHVDGFQGYFDCLRYAMDNGMAFTSYPEVVKGLNASCAG